MDDNNLFHFLDFVSSITCSCTCIYYTFSKKRALYILFNSIVHFKYQRALVILLRIEILQHRVLTTLLQVMIQNRTHVTPGLGWKMMRNFKAEKL